jgi:hypothetical protein
LDDVPSLDANNSRHISDHGPTLQLKQLNLQFFTIMINVLAVSIEVFGTLQ